MEIKKILATLILSGLVGACGSAPSDLASIDQNATTIQASCADSTSTMTARAGDTGGSRRWGTTAPTGDTGGSRKSATLAGMIQCSSYLVEIFGVCNDCGSVLVEAGDNTVSVTVNEDGTFSYSFETPTISNIDLTPLSF